MTLHGRNQKEHDENIDKLFIRCKENGIKLNKEKSETNKDHIIFIGLCITKDGLKIDEENKGDKQDAETKELKVRRFIAMTNKDDLYRITTKSCCHLLNC